jgi:hypothetical protein
MSDALNVFVPLLAFMLLPVWIPILGVTVGWIADQFGRRRKHDAFAARLAAPKERSHAHRVAHQQREARPTLATDAA